jgi:two-component system response regulator AtoC
MPNVLIVDDEEDTRTLLVEALRRKGVAVDAVASGSECLAWVRDHDVDVVVTDVQMPGVTGVQLCELLRDRYPNVLALILTGLGTYDIAIESVRSGAYDYLTKPVKIDALVVALERAFEHLA